jgi:hypothetical protein
VKENFRAFPGDSGAAPIPELGSALGAVPCKEIIGKEKENIVRAGRFPTGMRHFPSSLPKINILDDDVLEQIHTSKTKERGVLR